MSGLIGDLLVARWRVRRRDEWKRGRLEDYQANALARLRLHALEHSAYFATHHRGLERAPLAELPPLTKERLMASWDGLVTSPTLSLDSVTRRLRELETGGTDPGRPWQGRWWMAATAGSTGQRAVFVWNRREWISILSSYSRVNDWAGVKVGPRRRLPTAIVSTRNPAHQSAVVGASLSNALVPTLRLDAIQPIDELVAALNRFHPRLLVCYASMLIPLAEAQLTGGLRIGPETVITASEEQLAPARLAAMEAWGVQVINTYAATETATIASMCSRGSMHVYEDFVVVEPVDNDYRPVPDGQVAERLLVTVLFSRTLPLIRYELTDSVCLAAAPCPCGSPYKVLESVVGRTEATLQMSGANGDAVSVHPNVFHDAIEQIAVHGWQVEQTDTGVTVRVVDPDHRVDYPHLTTKVRAGLVAAGVSANVTVVVERVGELARSRMGKAPLIVRREGSLKLAIPPTHSARFRPPLRGTSSELLGPSTSLPPAQ
ncbi:MAG TPA: phenylacetate--CoA ligase family protein [Actinomycetota bacterium]|nr:phenylacetate--CoA ligase family protein [Actinomycetota bacterium]